MVSIHAPARGATEGSRRWLDGQCCFNPRARAGRDVGDERRVNGARLVSIHAPARGATTFVR